MGELVLRFRMGMESITPVWQRDQYCIVSFVHAQIM